MSLTTDQIKELDQLFWRTSTTRFIASARAGSWLRALQISLIASNSYLISLSALAFAGRIKPEYVTIAAFSAIVASVFLLGFGLYIQFSGLEHKALKLYDSARVARKLMYDIKHSASKSYQDLMEEYNRAIDPLPNHTIIDNDSFVLQNRAGLAESRPKDVRLPALIEAGIRVIMFYLFPVSVVYFATTILPLTVLVIIGKWN